MKLESIFYIVGGIFLFAAIVYFAYEYLISFSKWLKILMLLCITLAVYFLAKDFEKRGI